MKDRSSLSPIPIFSPKPHSAASKGVCADINNTTNNATDETDGVENNIDNGYNSPFGIADGTVDTADGAVDVADGTVGIADGTDSMANLPLNTAENATLLAEYFF